MAKSLTVTRPLPVDVIDAEGRTLVQGKPVAHPATVPSATAARYSRHIGRQILVELFSGSKYTGTLQRIEGDAVILDTVTLRASAIVALSDVLLPMYSPQGRR